MPDSSPILASIQSLDLQVGQVLQDVSKIIIPDSYKNISHVVISGMGGSALGGRIVKSLTTSTSRVPIEIITGYTLPAYVNSKTLVIISSYSGNTEETVSAFHEAHNKNAKVLVITTGGKLQALATKEKTPAYIFTPSANPSKQPRMSLGYSTTAILVLLAKLSVIDILEKDLLEAQKTTTQFIQEFGPSVPDDQNIAKALAKKLAGKIPILFASDHLLGVAHAFKNQLNENAKTFTALFDLPEANHHLLEGLQFPLPSKNLLHFLFFESDNYPRAILKGYPITQSVVQKNHHEVSVYKTRSHKKLDEIFEILVLGSYIGYYLAELNKIDPVPIPWVDYFKSKL